MSVAPHAGIVDFGTFTPPTSSVDGIQGEVPQPLAGQQNYVLTANGWVALSSLGTLVFQGTWDASTNTPTLVSSVGVQGYYYVVSVAGNTNLNGITTWTVGDWAIFSGSVWQKIEGGSTVDITGGTINGTVIGNTNPAAGTFTTVGIDTSGTDAQIAPNTGITGWNYSGLSKSIAAQENAPTGLFFSPDGLNMYVCGSTGDDVNQYTLSTAWDVSTATFLQLFSTAAQDTNPQDVFFKPDGLSMYIMGSANDTVFQYTLSSAWDISTASYASKSFSVTSQENSATGLWFKSDGTVMYVIGSTNDTVFQYNLGTAWDVSTASYASISFSVASQENTPNQVNLGADGLTMWVLGSNGDDISEYALGTAWNVSTATFVNNLYVGFQDTGPNGLFIDSTAANRVYMAGQTNDTVFQYNTATNSISAVTDVFNTTSNAKVQGNLAVQSNAYVDGTFAAQGSTTFSGPLTATSTITLQGTASSTTALGTAATTGTTTIGGTSQTGAITVGQSTAAQTLNLGTGATASATTKTLNIGTAGVSGSTTAINIGSAVSGATSTTTLNGSVNIASTNITGGTINGTTIGATTPSTGAFTDLTASGTTTLGANGANTQTFLANPGSGAFPWVQTSHASGEARIRVAATSGAAVFSLSSLGSGTIRFYTDAFTNEQFRVARVASAVNYVQAIGAVTTGSPVVSAQGSDTNIPLVLQPKGTGALQAQQADSTTTGGNARGANAVDWQMARSAAATRVASGAYAAISGGINNSATGFASITGSGDSNQSTGTYSSIGGGASNVSSGVYSSIVGGYTNSATGRYNFIGNGSFNSGTATAAVTTQSATMNGTTAVTLAASNASIKVGQLITGTSINNFPDTYVAAISGTSLTLSQAASGSSTSTLSFFTPHGVVVGGGNNQATGSYSFIGGGGDAGTAANRNVASGDWSFVGGGRKNTASGIGSVVGGGGTEGTNIFGNTASGPLSTISGGWNNNASASFCTVAGGQSNNSSGLFAAISGGSENTASGYHSAILGGNFGTTRGITGMQAISACSAPIAGSAGVSQGGMLVLGVQTTDATATALRSNTSAAGTTNQVILPNNSAYYFKGSVIANVTGAANGAAWSIEGAIMRGANAASTVLIDTPSVNRVAASAGATTWAVAVTADTTNGGIRVTVTGVAATTIRWVCKMETTEVTF